MADEHLTVVLHHIYGDRYRNANLNTHANLSVELIEKNMTFHI